MKRHHPDVFCAALLNAQPMGFYAPAQIVRDAHEHDVEVRLSDQLDSVGDRDAPFPLPHGRGDEGHHGGTAVDNRSPAAPVGRPRDIYVRTSRWRRCG
jgi:hypothetical protein